LFGRLDQDANIRLMNRPIAMNDELVTDIGDSESANDFLRFASPCQGALCDHWNGKCRIPEILEAMSVSVPHAEGLQPCPIRPNCRWFEQSGKAACGPCMRVVRDGVASQKR